MIEFKNVRKVFTTSDRETVAVNDVSLTISEDETLCLIGPSGCGKTTTMKLINRMIEPTSGEILVDGTNVTQQDVISLRRSIGYVTQKGGLFPHMTVARNVGMPCELQGWSAEKAKNRIRELLELINLPAEEYADRYPRELSGGQRQRVGVARALALDPKYILMDEPFGALDPITRRQIHQEFLQLKNAVKKTIIIVTHDMAEAFYLGDRIALMDQGSIVQLGTEDDFRQHPANEFVSEFVSDQLTIGESGGNAK